MLGRSNGFSKIGRNTYNEKENIEKIIRTIFGLNQGFHILIIDDGSPDKTGEIVKNMMKEFPESLYIIERKGKLGLGTAYITGFKWALEHNYNYIFELERQLFFRQIQITISPELLNFSACFNEP